MHMVHINTEYGGLTQALREADGLAVFGFLFEASNCCSHTTSLQYGSKRFASVHFSTLRFAV